MWPNSSIFTKFLSADYSMISKLIFWSDFILFTAKSNERRIKHCHYKIIIWPPYLQNISADKKYQNCTDEKKSSYGLLAIILYTQSKYTFWYKTCYLSELQRTHGRIIMQAISKFDKLAWLHFGYCVHIFCTKKTHIHLPFTLGILTFILASDWFILLLQNIIYWFLISNFQIF